MNRLDLLRVNFFNNLANVSAYGIESNSGNKRRMFSKINTSVNSRFISRREDILKMKANNPKTIKTTSLCLMLFARRGS